MLKQFHSIWKNATLKKFQIVVRRFASSASVVQVHNYQLKSLNQSYTNFAKPNLFLPSVANSCEKRNTVRRINNTAANRQTNLNRSANVKSKYKQMEANLKWRANPVIAKLETQQFKSILRKNIMDLVAIFEKYNYEIRIAGGAVR